MHDSRLLGTWISDARLTVRELAARNDIPDAAKSALARVFGKLELRYTHSRCYATLNGETRVHSYKVVAKDATSVAIVSNNSIDGSPVIFHIHFEGDRYWIPLGSGRIREFFKRRGRQTHSRSTKG